jgi:hypothetical protein
MLLAFLLPVPTRRFQRQRSLHRDGCIDGLTVTFAPALMGKGTYTFDVTVDGTAYACDATIPLEGSSTVCGTGGVVSIFLSGTELDPSKQSLPGVHVEGAPKSVQIQVHRDKALVADADLSPKYQECSRTAPIAADVSQRGGGRQHKGVRTLPSDEGGNESEARSRPSS